MSDDTCKTCIWGRDKNSYTDGGEPIHGRKCRRNPPIVTGGHMSPIVTAWPLVQDNDYCAYWQGEPELPHVPF